MEFKDTKIKLNEILKKNDLTLVNDFVDEFAKLLEDKPQFFIDMNNGLIRRSYNVVVSLYGEKATLEHFKILISDKGREMIEECVVKNLKLEDEISWFLHDYFPGFEDKKGTTKTCEHCVYSRNLIDAMV